VENDHPIQVQERSQQTRRRHWSYSRIHIRDIDLLPTDPWCPPVDVYEMEGEILFVMELAGIDPGQVHVVLEEQDLLISGYRKSPLPPGTVEVHRLEIGHGAFLRRLRVPIAVDASDIQCRVLGGYVVVTLPKRVEHPGG